MMTDEIPVALPQAITCRPFGALRHFSNRFLENSVVTIQFAARRLRGTSLYEMRRARGATIQISVTAAAHKLWHASCVVKMHNRRGSGCLLFERGGTTRLARPLENYLRARCDLVDAPAGSVATRRLPPVAGVLRRA